MKRLVPGMLLLFAAVLPAQNLIDTFTYPNAATVPGWTMRTGTWKILNGHLIPTAGRTYHYITNDTVPVTADCVVDVEVIYPTVTSLHFGGVLARHPGTGSGTFPYMKIQDNSSVGTGAFNRAFLYGVSPTYWFDVVPPTKKAVCRLFVQGTQAWMEIDGDLDGIFEQVSQKSTTAATSGLVGISGYNAAEMDNWKFYEGALVADASTAPKIGTTYKMNFTAPMNGGSKPVPTPWVGLLSAGYSGIPLPGGVTIPLSFDALLVGSLSFGWNGVFMKPGEVGTLSVPIPNLPIFVGLKFYAAALTFDGTRPGGFGAVSNSHGFVVQ